MVQLRETEFREEFRYVPLKVEDGTGSGKRPKHANWQHTLFTFDEVNRDSGNKGLLLGAHSDNVYCFDFDGENHGDTALTMARASLEQDSLDVRLRPILEKFLMSARYQSSPNQIQLLVKIQSENLTKWKIHVTFDEWRNNGWELEFLANGQQCVLPPSVCSKPPRYAYFERHWLVALENLQTFSTEEYVLFREWYTRVFTAPESQRVEQPMRTFAIDVEQNPQSHPQQLLDDVVYSLLNSPLFIESRDADGVPNYGNHRRNTYFHALAKYFRRYSFNLEDTLYMINSLAGVVANESGRRDADPTVRRVYSRELGSEMLEAETTIRRIMEVRINPADRRSKTHWKVFSDLLQSASNAYQALLRRANAAADAERDRFLRASTTTRPVVDDLYDYCEQNLDSEYRYFNRVNEKTSRGQWRKFDERGFYIEVHQSEVESAIHDLIREYGEEPHRYFSRVKSRICDGRCTDESEYDNPKYLLINNHKVINSEEYCVEDFDRGNPKHKFTRMENRNLVEPSDRHLELIDKMLRIVTAITDDPEVRTIRFPFGDASVFQREQLLQCLTNAVWNFLEDKITLLLIGPASAAKSVIIDIFNNMFPQTTGAFRIQDLGNNGGVANIYNKRIGTQNELNGGYFSKETIEKLKDINSNTSKITIRLLYKNPFDVCMNIFLMVASNQLPKSPSVFESDSTYKRFLILFCPNIYSRNESLVREYESADFLDACMSYFLSREPKPVIEDMDEHIERTRNLYQWSSDPVLRVIKSLFVVDYSDMDGLETETVYQCVEQQLADEGLERPSKLPEKVHKALDQIGVPPKARSTRVVQTNNGQAIKESYYYFKCLRFRSGDEQIYSVETQLGGNSNA